MTAKDIVKQLSKLGNEGYKAIMARHGAVEPYFGVKIEELKKFQKKIKKDYKLALDLYDTGIGDAMYLAGLIADEAQMTKRDLAGWLDRAPWGMISEYTVAWVAAESRYGFELAKEWIESGTEYVAAAGWNTLSSLVAVKSDDELPIKELEKLLDRVAKQIHKAPNRVRYTMNNFVIAVGASVAALTTKAKAIARQVGEVTVDMGDTACQVPSATAAIEKIAKKGKIGRKRKTARC
jgi:3-methyladenine DNA glycosylase AlkD